MPSHLRGAHRGGLDQMLDCRQRVEQKMGLDLGLKQLQSCMHL